jgi:hypothetical protein
MKLFSDIHTTEIFRQGVKALCLILVLTFLPLEEGFGLQNGMHTCLQESAEDSNPEDIYDHSLAEEAKESSCSETSKSSSEDESDTYIHPLERNNTSGLNVKQLIHIRYNFASSEDHAEIISPPPQ